MRESRIGRRTLPDRSSETGCSRDQKQSRPDDDRSNGSRHAFTGRRKTFGGHCYRNHSHRAQVHDSDDEEDCCQIRAAASAVEAEA
jgi:hypothetical protein